MFINPKSGTSNVVKARESWGENPPEWLLALARTCDLTSQKIVGRTLGKSGGYISRIISRSYAGSYEEAELLVRSRISLEEVICPVWKAGMPLAFCIRTRRKKTLPGNYAERLYAATCPDCPNNTDVETDED